MPLLRGRTFPLFDDARAIVRVPVRAVIATAIATAALLLVGLLEPLIGRPYYFPAFAAIVLASVLAGAKYGVLATVTFGVGYALVYLAPRGSVAVKNRYEFAALVGYSVTGAFVAVVGGALRSAYARLRAQNRALHAIQEQREDLLRTLTHDIRSPLGVITLSAGALSRGRQDPDDVLRRAQAIERSVTRVAAMLRDLVDTAHLESGHLPLERRSVDLATYATELTQRLSGTVGLERIQLAVPPGLPAVHVDPGRFERVLVNLLTNALKYAPAPTPVVLAAAARGPEVLLEVRDRGPGIPPQDLPHVFEKYYRASETRAQEGTGLGLYITRLLVEAHGGRIWASSSVGQGTTFHVAIPAAPAPERQAPPAEPRPRAAPSP
jgi:signal transduction histidine kinase